MGPENESKLQEAIEAAIEDFWLTITTRYPEIKTGHVNPLTDKKFEEAARQTVLAWLRLNAPATVRGTSARCDFVVEMRPPKKGERGMYVEALTAKSALAEVLASHHDPNRLAAAGPSEFGWIAAHDHVDEFDENGLHAVTIRFTPYADRELDAKLNAALIRDRGPQCDKCGRLLDSEHECRGGCSQDKDINSLEENCTVGAGVPSRVYTRETAQRHAYRMPRILVDVDVLAEGALHVEAWALEHDSHGYSLDDLCFLEAGDAPDEAERGRWVRLPWLDQPAKK